MYDSSSRQRDAYMPDIYWAVLACCKPPSPSVYQNGVPRSRSRVPVFAAALGMALSSSRFAQAAKAQQRPNFKKIFVEAPSANTCFFIVKCYLFPRRGLVNFLKSAFYQLSIRDIILAILRLKISFPLLTVALITPIYCGVSPCDMCGHNMHFRAPRVLSVKP